MTRWIVLRHAHAESHGPSDRERPLAPAGRDEARVMGRWLKDLGWTPDLVISGPSLRGRQTAEELLDAADADPEIQIVEEIYSGDADDYLEALRASQAECTLLVGHLPTIDEVVLRLAPDAPRTPSGRFMTTAAAACFEDGSLVHLQRPDGLSPVQGAGSNA